MSELEPRSDAAKMLKHFNRGETALEWDSSRVFNEILESGKYAKKVIGPGGSGFYGVDYYKIVTIEDGSNCVYYSNPLWIDLARAIKNGDPLIRTQTTLEVITKGQKLGFEDLEKAEQLIIEENLITVGAIFITSNSKKKTDRAEIYFPSALLREFSPSKALKICALFLEAAQVENQLGPFRSELQKFRTG